jgi:hypothetical protein
MAVEKISVPIIDALNYMGKEGWAFVNAYPVNIGDTQIYHYGFKKLFFTIRSQRKLDLCNNSINHPLKIKLQ